MTLRGPGFWLLVVLNSASGLSAHAEVSPRDFIQAFKAFKSMQEIIERETFLLVPEEQRESEWKRQILILHSGNQNLSQFDVQDRSYLIWSQVRNGADGIYVYESTPTESSRYFYPLGPVSNREYYRWFLWTLRLPLGVSGKNTLSVNVLRAVDRGPDYHFFHVAEADSPMTFPWSPPSSDYRAAAGGRVDDRFEGADQVLAQTLLVTVQKTSELFRRWPWGRSSRSIDEMIQEAKKVGRELLLHYPEVRKAYHDFLWDEFRQWDRDVIDWDQACVRRWEEDHSSEGDAVSRWRDQNGIEESIRTYPGRRN